MSSISTHYRNDIATGGTWQRNPPHQYGRYRCGDQQFARGKLMLIVFRARRIGA
jgi:hypothetical protein